MKKESGYLRLSRHRLLIKNFRLRRRAHRVSGPLNPCCTCTHVTRRVPCVFPSARPCRWLSLTRACMYVHARTRAIRPRTIYVEFDSGTSHTRAYTRRRVNQRIGTLDSSTHIIAQSARRHLKDFISVEQVYAGRIPKETYASYQCVPRINYAPSNDTTRKENPALDIPSERSGHLREERDRKRTRESWGANTV
ncbi:hypothetical protein PUN28_001658 [Cardiocondyla obscurior]|uniref:Uncharacterized protein n=1 Tax=Cardiocondyla obscurior TaxID=286306 RepID=A0AAW2GQM0_9HYME